MKPHEFRELMNELRDTAIKYRDHQQLRERIVDVLLAHEVFPAVLRPVLAAAAAPEAKPRPTQSYSGFWRSRLPSISARKQSPMQSWSPSAMPLDPNHPNADILHARTV